MVESEDEEPADKEGQLYVDDTKVVVDRLPKSFIARLYKIPSLAHWTWKKRETLMLNSGLRSHCRVCGKDSKRVLSENPLDQEV